MSDLQENLEDRLNEPRRQLPSAAQKGGASSASFFTVYRPHQGGWTRLGTAIASALFIGSTALFLAYEVGPSAGWDNVVQRGQAVLPEQWKHSPTPYVVIAWVVLSSLLAWWAQNKAMHVEFMIDTDSEMKKVNWTSRAELIGSTKVVIFFMLIMSAMLFLIDLMFQFFFYSIHVLKFSPFQTGGK